MRAFPEDLSDWLAVFSKAVRERDFASGRKLFDEQVTAFGTVCSRVDSLDALVDGQWRAVWLQTVDFDFDYASARSVAMDSLAIIMIGWRSIGFAPDQKPVERHGRATIVLQQSTDGWKAVHTHFSINPQYAHDPVLRHAGPR